jgi:hypothetical protein
MQSNNPACAEFIGVITTRQLIIREKRTPVEVRFMVGE